MNRNWWKEALVYQIYPRSFKDSNNDGIGDIRGIIEKLDYLVELGVNVIWLSPFYKSPNDDNGYDISDYREVHEEFGTLEDIKELFSISHEKGIKILVDLVVNHSSDEHPWFIESKKSKNNKYSDYYIWKDKNPNNENSYPNNWGSVFSGPTWEYVKERDQFYLHVFSKKQPDLNWENEELRNEVYAIMNYWIDLGADGFRMDVINLISKQFKNDTYDGEEYFFNGPKIHDYLREMNDKVLKGRDLMTVGECPGASFMDALKFANIDNSELNMIFTFEHMDVDSRDGKWDFIDFDLLKLKKILSSWQVNLNEKAWNSLYLNNHDQPRMVSRFGDDKKYRVESSKMLGHVIHTMQGTPYIYQGEEIGMTNVPFNIPEELRDLESINAINENNITKRFTKDHMNEAILKKGRDNARTPMQWNNGENAGFTQGTPWLMVNPNYKDINVENALKDKNSTFYFYKKLIQNRKENPVIVYGDFKEYLEESKTLYVFKREFEGKTLISINSFTQNEETIDLTKDLDFDINEFKVLISNYDNLEFDGDLLKLKPYQCISLISK